MRPSAQARLAATAALATLALGGCTYDAETAVEARGAAVSYVLAEQVEGGLGTSLSLADLAPFHWDRLFVFAAGTPTSTIRDSVPVRWPGLAHYGATVPDSVTLLVFVAGGQVLAAAAHPRTRGDFAPERTGRGYAPAEAVFRVDSTRVGTRRRRVLR